MGKTTIHISCIDQRLTVTDGPLIASGGQNEDEIVLDFCPLWDGFEKVAVFYREGGKAYQVAISKDKCIVPHEVLETEGFMFFGVFGVKGSATRTTEVLKYKVVKGALTDGTKPTDPTPDIYQQYIDLAGNLSSEIAFMGKQLNYDYGYLAVSGNPMELGDVQAAGPGVTVDQPLHCVETFDTTWSAGSSPSPDNVLPLNGASSATLVSCGKNLVNMFDAQSTSSGSVGIEKTANSLRVYTIANGTYRGVRLPNMLLRRDRAYTLSARMSAFVSGTVRVGFRSAKTNSYLTGGSISFTAVGRKSVTIRPAEDILVYLSMLVTSSTSEAGDATFTEVQVELNEPETLEYEPYEGYTYTADFGEPVGGGVLDWAAGRLTVTHELLTFNGTEDWKMITGDNPYWYLTLGPRGSADVSSEKCSHFGQATITSSNANIGCDILNSGTNDECRLTIRPGVGSVTSTATWKEYLTAQAAAGTPVQVCYQPTVPRVINVQPGHVRLVKTASGKATVYSNLGGDIDATGYVNLRWLLHTMLDRIDRLEAELAARN